MLRNGFLAPIADGKGDHLTGRPTGPLVIIGSKVQLGPVNRLEGKSGPCYLV